MRDISGARILVTGSSSMIGLSVCKILEQRNAGVVKTSHNIWDLIDQRLTNDLFEHYRPDYVIHLATYSGNISFNQKYPADTYYRTTQMGLNVLRFAQKYQAEKIVSVLSSCAIADLNNVCLTEDKLWQGLPNPTIECHGLAKRNLHAYSRQIFKQYGTPTVCCILNNSYGPNDSYNPNKTKVIGGLIRRFVEAKQQNLPEVVCWGTGSPLREFVYCDDAAEAIVQVLERYENSMEPINIASDEEVSIKTLAETIAEIIDYPIENIKWDTTKPDGQMRKSLSSEKMKRCLDLKFTPLRDGLRNTIFWYLRNKEEADAKGI